MRKVMFGGAWFTGARRERVGKAAERMAAEAAPLEGPSPFSRHALMVDVEDEAAVAAAVARELGLGEQPPVQVRDLPLERRLTARAAEVAGVKCVGIGHFAEHRAFQHPEGERLVRDPGDRDFTMEVLEELADARNYLVWEATRETRRPVPDRDIIAAAFATLVFVVGAFDAAMGLYELQRNTRRVA